MANENVSATGLIGFYRNTFDNSFKHPCAGSYPDVDPALKTPYALIAAFLMFGFLAISLVGPIDSVGCGTDVMTNVVPSGKRQVTLN